MQLAVHNRRTARCKVITGAHYKKYPQSNTFFILQKKEIKFYINLFMTRKTKNYFVSKFSNENQVTTLMTVALLLYFITVCITFPDF